MNLTDFPHSGKIKFLREKVEKYKIMQKHDDSIVQFPEQAY